MSTAPPHSDPPAPKTAAPEHDALPAGTRFGEFEILRMLGVGGFGIVYLARDHSLEREVALKEYMPASLAMRGSGPQITIRSSAAAETYAIGLRSFVNEARLLARFDHPSLVKVYRFWEDNATAYMVMPYLQGITLRDTRRAMAHAPDERWIRGVIDPILNVLELLHREGVYHRDIAPDNILLPPEGPSVLLDFGAARRVISDRTQSLTAILKPSYAPIEQYAEMTQLRQGPWTDLYALGAVVHYLLFGVPPQPATARAIQDDGESIADRSVPGVSPRMLEAMAWALAIRPNQRPQSVDELRGALDGRISIPAPGRQSITLPGGLAPLVGRGAPAPSTSEYEPTMRVESTFSEPTRLDSTHMPTVRWDAPSARTAMPAMAPPWPPSSAGDSHPIAGPGFEPAAAVPYPDPTAAPFQHRGGQTAALSAPAGQTFAPAPPVAPPNSPAGTGAVSSRSGSKVGLVVMLVVVLVVAGIAFWQFSRSGSEGVAVAPAASAVAPTATASAAKSPTPAIAVVMPAASAVGESVTPLPPAAAVAARVNAPVVQAAVVPVPTASASTKVAAAATAASAATSRPRALPKNPSQDAAGALNAGVERRDEFRPQTPDPDSRPRPAATREPASPSRPVIAGEGTLPSSAREACGSRAFIALAICMDRECEQPQFRNSAECVRVLDMKRARENR